MATHILFGARRSRDARDQAVLRYCPATRPGFDVRCRDTGLARRAGGAPTGRKDQLVGISKPPKITPFDSAAAWRFPITA